MSKNTERPDHRSITFWVHRDLQRQVKVRAIEEERSVSEIMKELLEEYLKANPPKGS